MATFIQCSCEQTEYRGNKITNGAVNIDIVAQVSKYNESWYPDNEGTPAIRFCSGDSIIHWIYGKDQLANRDADYEKIVNNKF